MEAYLDETFAGDVHWTITSGVDDVPEATAGLVYRLAREAIFNTFKHAHATQVAVTLTQVDRTVVAEIVDDGVGFDPPSHAVSERGHLGLAYCHELAEAAGGTWTCTSAPGSGTTVRITMPA